MTVAELIEELKKQDQNAEVVYNFVEDINDYGYYETDCSIYNISRQGEVVVLS